MSSEIASLTSSASSSSAASSFAESPFGEPQQEMAFMAEKEPDMPKIPYRRSQYEAKCLIAILAMVITGAMTGIFMLMGTPGAVYTHCMTGKYSITLLVTPRVDENGQTITPPLVPELANLLPHGRKMVAEFYATGVENVEILQAAVVSELNMEGEMIVEMSAQVCGMNDFLRDNVAMKVSNSTIVHSMWALNNTLNGYLDALPHWDAIAQFNSREVRVQYVGFDNSTTYLSEVYYELTTTTTTTTTTAARRMLLY